MEGELVGTQDPVNFGATCADIHMGSVSLPNLTAIQPSVSSASNQESEPPAIPASLHLLKTIAATQQQPHRPPVPLHPGGKKRAGEILHPQLEKKHKGQGTVPRTGGDRTGHPLLHYSGMTEVKPEPVSPLPLTPSQAPAPEDDCRQKANVIPGSSQTHVATKVDAFAIPGSSEMTGNLQIEAAEGIWELCSNPKMEKKRSVKAEKMDSGGEICSSECSWMTH